MTSNLSNNDGAEILISQNATSKSIENQQDNVLISQFATSKPIERRGGTQKPPYAFTRNGIGMLSSVLRSEAAVGVNILIMRAFTAIPQIVNQNVQIVQRIFNIEQHQMETDEKIEMILDKIEEIASRRQSADRHHPFALQGRSAGGIRHLWFEHQSFRVEIRALPARYRAVGEDCW